MRAENKNKHILIKFFRTFQATVRDVFETIESECNMRNGMHGFEDFITIVAKQFEKTFEAMNADNY